MLNIHVRRFAAVGMLWLAPCAAAFAQTNSDAIVVTGRTTEQAQRFVEHVSAAPATADQLARWDTTICTSIAGLPARQGQFIADRIAQRAAAVGLQPGAAGCNPNVSIIVAADADAAARRINEENSALFAARAENNVSTLGSAAFQAFLDNNQPVRWWHVAQTRTADGMQLDGDASMGGMSNAPAARSHGSRLRGDTREDLNRVIVIVDASRVGNVQLSALADYVAMVSLAQIKADADTSGFASILNLFSSSRQLTAMTDWDVAYLSGLYTANRSAQTVQQQQRDIARRMQTGGQS